MMSGTLLDAPAAKAYGNLMLIGTFDGTGFSVGLMAKDASPVKEACRPARTPMALACLQEDRFPKEISR
ncbi:MAG: hypothetical protein LBQ12_14910 [Deltaproteobacteria bacterium]|jgi:3-hydroxyisobutyrate dehydrogenase-like beta-hydroxyacid dehydrogenase|nr:hypothetical protein [Deltaproteobacteria bacterium]